LHATLTACLLTLDLFLAGAEALALPALRILLFAMPTIRLPLLLLRRRAACFRRTARFRLAAHFPRGARGGALLSLLSVLAGGRRSRAPFVALLLLVLTAMKSAARKRRRTVKTERTEGESRRQPDSDCRFFHAHHEAPPVHRHRSPA
jgi:hypothetical protein